MHQWGVILAGGNGTRLLPLTRSITGDDRPKQFCPLIGSETLLDQTQVRVAKAVSPERTLLELNKEQEVYYSSHISALSSDLLLVQPQNRGTTAAILYALLHIRKVDPNAIVAFFPSDHYFSDDAALVSHVRLAFSAAASHPQMVFMLGITPDYAEKEYGWIEPASRLTEPSFSSVFRVRRFWEKPTEELAQKLMDRGCLWNSFLLVGKVSAFLTLTQRTVPELFDAFSSACQIPFTAQGAHTLRRLYEAIPTGSFSEQVLSAHPLDLAVIRTQDLEWADLGSPGRVSSVIQRKGMGRACRRTTIGALTAVGNL